MTVIAIGLLVLLASPVVAALVAVAIRRWAPRDTAELPPGVRPVSPQDWGRR